VCIFALLTQHALHLHAIVIRGLPGTKIFPNYLIKGKIKKKSIELKMHVLIFPTNLCEIFLILRRTEQDMMKNLY